MEEELDDILGSGNEPDLVPISDLIKNTAEPTVDSRNVNHELNKPQRSKYDGPFSHLSKPALRAISDEFNTGKANSFIKRPEPEDFVTQAANNSVWGKRILDENDQEVELNPGEWKDSWNAVLGQHGMLYERPRKGTENSFREGLQKLDPGKLIGLAPSHLATTAIEGYLEKFDDQQEYDFLVPVINPKTGKPMLKMVSGTREEIAKKGYNRLNKFGTPSESDNFIVSQLKAFANTAGQTDDVLITGAKYLQDLGEFVTSPLRPEGFDVKTDLDEIYEDTKTDTHYGDFLPSKDTEDFGSLNWFMHGTGSAFASLLQFGGVGSGIRAGVGAIDAVGMAFGKKAIKDVVYNKIASYGSSGIIGFGYGYDEALQNGLEDGEALLFGTLVGAANAAIEARLGTQFDTFLTGGGVKAIAKDIYKELNGEVTEASTKKLMKDRLSDVVESAGSRAKNMASEGAEEVLQDVVEQSAKLTYNALLADPDAEDGEGKFNNRQFDFMQTVSAGIFGAVAAAPFNSTGRKVVDHVLNGKAKEVHQANDQLLASGKITETQHARVKEQTKKIEEAFELNKNLFDGLSGEYSQNLKMEAFELVSQREKLRQAKDKVIEGLKDKPVDEAEKAKPQIEQIEKKIADLNSRIENYTKPDFLKNKVQEYKKRATSENQNKDNIFNFLAAQADYTTDKSPEDTKKRIGTLTGDGFKFSPVVRTAEEAGFLLNILPSLDASIAPVAKQHIEQQKFHLSPLVNTMQNRQALLELGFTEEQLPMTPEEKAEYTALRAEAVVKGQQAKSQKMDPARNKQMQTELFEAVGDKTNFEKIKDLLDQPLTEDVATEIYQRLKGEKYVDLTFEGGYIMYEQGVFKLNAEGADGYINAWRPSIGTPGRMSYQGSRINPSAPKPLGAPTILPSKKLASNSLTGGKPPVQLYKEITEKYANLPDESNPRLQELAVRYITPDAFSRAVESVTPEQIAADPELKREDNQYTEYDKLKYILKHAGEFGITAAMLHSLDASSQLPGLLNQEQAAMLENIRKAFPASIILNDAKGELKGVYHKGTGIIAISGDIQKHKGKLLKVLAHEMGHGIFDREIELSYAAWRRVLNNRESGNMSSAVDRFNSAYFDRMLKLANIAYDMGKDLPKAKRLYFFNTIAARHQAMDAKGKADNSLVLVKEFFAEAFGDVEFQAMLDGFDMNKAKNQDLLKQHNYHYKPITTQKESLLSQVVKAVSSVFNRLGGILSRNDRTVLTEAFALGSNLQYNKFIPYKKDVQKQKDAITDLAFSAFDPIDLYEGFVGTVDPDSLLATIYERIDRAKIILDEDQRERLLPGLRKFVKEEMFTDKHSEYLKGSMMVMFFKNTDNFLITWKTTKDGVDDQHRAFFNKYGDQVYMNTDVSNFTSKTSLGKHDAFYAFKPGSFGEANETSKEILNNLDQAMKENFEGETFLQYDEEKIWSFKGQDVQGQVTVIYTFKDGRTGIVGYAPDLTKVRLAHILNNGSSIKVKLSRSGVGSEAYVRRNDEGHILEAVRKKEAKDYDTTGMKLERFMPKVHFRYLPTSKVTEEAQEIADYVDTITPDNSKLEPRMDHGSISRENYFPEFSLFDEQPVATPPVQVQPGTIQDKIQYIRDGVERYLRRRVMFNNKPVVKDDFVNIISGEYIVPAAEYLKDLPEEQAKLLGFETPEEFVDFVQNVIDNVARDHSVRAKQKRDAEDWSGMGGNPSGRISVAIKTDLEALNFVYDGKKHWVDFGEAKDMLVEAAGRSHDFASMVQELKKDIDRGIYAGREKAIALSVHKHLSRDRSADNEANRFFHSVENSYWSQFGSYIRLDAITFAPQEESAFLYFNGERSYMKQYISDFTGNIVRQINTIRDKFPAESDPAKQYKNMKKDMTDFMMQRYMNKFIAQGMSTEEARAKVDSYIRNQNGSLSTVIDRMRQEMKAYESNPNKFFNTKGYTTSGINFNKREAYDKMVALIDSYFAYFGIEIPEALLNLELNQGNVEYRKQVKEKLEKEGHSEEDIKKMMKNFTDGLNINKYHLVAFKPSKNKEYGEYPFMVLANQTADWLTFEVEKTFKNDPKANLAISELDQFVKILTKQAGNYRSPEFYFNAEFEKEWSLKTRSYLDDLVSNLTSNKDGLLDTYLNAPLYQENRFLKTIKAAKGQPVQFMISGINGVHNSSKSKSYNNANDLDYLYMNLAGFVHNPNSPYYMHIDDVPSDKPRNMAFRMARVTDKELKGELEKIYELEGTRLAMANTRFFEVFEMGEKKGEFVVEKGKEDAFKKLIPKVHYKEIRPGVYAKGTMYDQKLYFYEGKKPAEVAKIIEQESIASFNEFREKGMQFPVSAQFLKELKEKNLPETEYRAALVSEQQRVFNSWRNNFIINRYHLNQVVMGDYMYYKDDEFTDLNKRHAGTSAPFSRAVHAKPRTKVTIMKDADHDTPDGKIKLVKTKKNESGKWIVDDNPENATNITSSTNRTDAQGYVTEQYAEILQKGYGAFSGYEKVFKPVMFGVSRDMIEHAQPLYLKLSLAVLPDPSNPQNVDYFERFPAQLPLAQKLYASGADFGVFESGVKVGINTINSLESDKFDTIEFDSNLLGLQNNPYHDPNSDENTLSGLVQMMKILGDNGNIDLMEEYYQIEGEMVNNQVQEWFRNKFEDENSVRDTVKERLARNEYSSPIADFVDAEVRVLDNPTTAKFAENLFNADFADAAALYPKNGEKLVNLSDYGYSRPKATDAEMGQRIQHLTELGITDHAYDDSLQWMGPRRPQDLTPGQLALFMEFDRQDYKIDEKTGYITKLNGEVVIFPAEALVPPGDNYKIGDRMISVRIPTSKKSNLTPTIVVGHLAPQQGNVIVLGKHVTGIHGLDFDVDGLFVWRERQHGFNKSLNRMFQLAYTVLTHPRNYNDVTSPVTTDNIKSIADAIDGLSGKGKKKYSKFSPERQLELKKLNSVGKRMISVSAMSSGIHSVLAQNDGSPFQHDDRTLRGYRKNKKEIFDKFETHFTDRQGNKVLISDVYSEFINASTDNAKLQLLGRLNINPITASVLFDMISHGVDMEYALYFINQPVIKKYVEKKEVMESASYTGSTYKVHEKLINDLEKKIQAIPGYEAYQFNARNPDGSTDQKSKAVSRYVKDKDKFTVTKSDDVVLTFDQLQDGISGRTEEKILSTPAEQLKEHYENQIVAMDKFMFYRELASITRKAGSLVTLTSSYPKTFIELVNRKEQIYEVIGGKLIGYSEKTGEPIYSSPKINIDGLMNSHGMYKMHWRGLNDLITHYQRYKFYADPFILQIHDEIAGMKPVELQQKVQDDFYTFVLTRSNESNNAAGMYNLSTSSLTGIPIDPYHFVNESAILVDKMKKDPALANNEFLRILNVKIEGTEEQWQDKAIEPNHVTTKLLYEPTGELLEKIREDFRKLPANYNGVNSTKDVILGHLLFTQGFGLGGFNFSKILPEEVVKSFDQIIEAEHESFKSLRFIDEMEGDQESEKDGYDYLISAGLDAFTTQVRMNHQELIREVAKEDLDKAINAGGSFFEFWKNDKGRIAAQRSDNVSYEGTAMKRTKRADGGEDIVIQYKKNHAENNRMVRMLEKEGLIRLRGADGTLRVFEVSPLQKTTVGKYKAAFIELKELNVRQFKNLKQYGDSMYFAEKSNALFKKTSYKQVDEELTEEPEPLPPYEFNFVQVPGEIDINAVREGKQTAIIVDALPAIQVGQSIQIPHSTGQALVKVKRMHELARAYAQGLKARNGDEQATMEAFTNFLARTTNSKSVNPQEALNKNLIEFTYEASLSPSGSIESTGVDFKGGNEFSEFNPIIEFSEYNPRKAAGLYKAVAKVVAEKLRTIEPISYEHAQHDDFFAALDEFDWKFGELEKQIIRDHLNHYGIQQTDTEEIAQVLDELSQMPSSIGLENYNTANVWERDEDSPMELLYELGSRLFGPNWYDKISLDFNRYANEVIDGDIINPITNMPFTHYELLDLNYGMYNKERARLNEIMDIVINDDGVNALTNEQLNKFWHDMSQMNAGDGFIHSKEKFKIFRDRLAHKIGNRFEAESFDIIREKSNSSDSHGQKDISSWDEYLVHITDFTERQAAMQHIGRLVDIAEIKSNMEKMNTNAAMDRLMGNVLRWHFAHKPKSWIDKIQRWKYSAQTRDAFDWMFEKDPATGEYTGQMVLRYAATEQQYKDEINARKKDEDGRDTPYFVISNRKAGIAIENRIDNLNEMERTRFMEIMDRYDGYNNFFEQRQTFTAEELRQSAKDTTYLRKLYVKAHVRDQDSQMFIDLKNEARQYAGTAKGDLAKAKIELYDFLYEKNNDLLSETGFEHYSVERGTMPQTKMSIQEMASRYGFKKAKAELLADTQEEASRLETENGVVVSLYRQQSFANSKSVPYRTLRKKEGFSVNAPTIFAHHFNTLIFKKHYDPVVPAMDAVQQHYIMKQKMGPDNFQNLVKYIEDFADLHIFYKKSERSKSKIARVATAFSSLAVTTFLGAAPITSGINLFVGLTESYKHMMGDYGFSEGSRKYNKGIRRTLTKRGGINQKAMAVMKFYGIETYSTSEIQQASDFIGEVQDKLLFWQKRSEIVVRASSLLAEMTDEQWNSLQMNENGEITAGPNAPKIEQVAEWLNRIGTIQGKYGIKRLYHQEPVYKNAMLFKGWLIDYIKSRIGGRYYDQWGTQREGYAKTAYRLVTTDSESRARLWEYYMSMFGRGDHRLTKLEEQNIRKLNFDILLTMMFLLLQEALGDEDEEETWYLNTLSKINGQLFLLTRPDELIRMVKNPFAGIHGWEQSYKMINSLMTLQFDKAADAGVSMIPGKQIWDPVLEATLYSEDEE